MTREERTRAIWRRIAEYTEAGTETPQKARDTLINEGLYTPDGDLNPHYRDEDDREDAHK